MTQQAESPLVTRTPASAAAVQERRDRTVALLLASAAVLAAIIATRASFLANEAAGHWQQAVRLEIQRAAATVEDVRYVYTSEAPLAYRIAEAQAREQAFREQAEGAAEEIQAALLFEADVQKGLADSLIPASEIAADPKYALPDGGFDLTTRLADNRALNPDLVAVDPDAEMDVGDRASAKAVMLVATGLPVGLALLLGALATAIARYRRILLAAGAVSLGAAVTLALAVEALA